MYKKLIIVFILVFMLVGCGKSNKLCDNIIKIADDNINNVITYAEFIEKIKAEYNANCTEDTGICDSINTYVTVYEGYIKMEKSCSDENLSSIEGYNALCKEQLEKKQQVENSKVTADRLKRSCTK